MALGHRLALPSSRRCPLARARASTASSRVLSSLHALDLFACSPSPAPSRGDAATRIPVIDHRHSNGISRWSFLRSAARLVIGSSALPDPLSPNNKCARNQRPATMEATMKDTCSVAARYRRCTRDGYPDGDTAARPAKTRRSNDAIRRPMMSYRGIERCKGEMAKWEFYASRRKGWN